MLLILFTFLSFIKLDKSNTNLVDILTKGFKDINEAYKVKQISRDYLNGFLQLLNPIAPHITEELWNHLGHTDTISYEPWPTFDEEKCKAEEYNLPIQINGKLRDKVMVSPDASKEEIEKAALALPRIIELTSGLTIRKVIVVPGKLVNIVAN